MRQGPNCLQNPSISLMEKTHKKGKQRGGPKATSKPEKLEVVAPATGSAQPQGEDQVLRKRAKKAQEWASKKKKHQAASIAGALDLLHALTEVKVEKVHVAKPDVADPKKEKVDEKEEDEVEEIPLFDSWVRPFPHNFQSVRAQVEDGHYYMDVPYFQTELLTLLWGRALRLAIYLLIFLSTVHFFLTNVPFLAESWSTPLYNVIFVFCESLISIAIIIEICLRIYIKLTNARYLNSRAIILISDIERVQREDLRADPNSKIDSKHFSRPARMSRVVSNGVPRLLLVIQKLWRVRRQGTYGYDYKLDDPLIGRAIDLELFVNARGSATANRNLTPTQALVNFTRACALNQTVRVDKYHHLDTDVRENTADLCLDTLLAYREVSMPTFYRWERKEVETGWLIWSSVTIERPVAYRPDTTLDPSEVPPFPKSSPASSKPVRPAGLHTDTV